MASVCCCSGTSSWAGLCSWKMGSIPINFPVDLAPPKKHPQRKSAKKEPPPGGDFLFACFWLLVASRKAPGSSQTIFQCQNWRSNIPMQISKKVWNEGMEWTYGSLKRREKSREEERCTHPKGNVNSTLSPWRNTIDGLCFGLFRHIVLG